MSVSDELKEVQLVAFRVGLREDDGPRGRA